MNVKPHLIRFSRLGLLSLYVMVTGCSDGTGSAPVYGEATLNLALLGVCFEAQPSGINGMTDVAGRYRYSVGDSVRFWVPASGNECRATQAQGSETSGFALGLISPRGMLDGSVLATFLPRFATGRQIVQMSQALNPEATGSSEAGSKSAPSASSLISSGTPASQPPLLTPVTPYDVPASARGWIVWSRRGLRFC